MEKQNNTEKIHNLIEKMNAMTLYRHFTVFERGGVMLSIVFYDDQGKEIDGYSTSGHNVIGTIIGTSDGNYRVFHSGITEEYMDWLCESAVLQ